MIKAVVLQKHYHSFTGLLSIHESFRNSVRCQDLISVNKRVNKYNHNLKQVFSLSPKSFFVVCYLCLNSWKTMRLGKPCLQMRIPSRTPLHLNWSRTRWGSSLPAWRKTQILSVCILYILFQGFGGLGHRLFPWVVYSFGRQFSSTRLPWQ